MRQRIARLGTEPSRRPRPWTRCSGSSGPTTPRPTCTLIERAYRTAEQAPRVRPAQSGDAYITHPLAVTTILAELGMTETDAVRRRCCTTPSRTPTTPCAQLTRDFGDEIALLVDGCTKLDKVKYGESAKSETIRKMIIAMSRDIRVLVIKLADRLHNMRTLHYLRPDKQSRIARRRWRSSPRWPTGWA